MNAVDQTLMLLFAGYGGLLMLFTLTGRVLAGAAAAGRLDRALAENFNTRTHAWWVMAALGSIALMAGRTGVIVAFALISLAAMREFLTLTRFRAADHWAVAAAVFVVLPLHYALIWVDFYAVYSIMIPVYAFLGLPILSALRGEADGFLTRIAEVQWALMVSVFCLSHVPALMSLQIPGFEGANILLIAFLIVVVQFSDVMQYVWGKIAGRHPVAPGLSPSKTVEGTVGGILTAGLIGGALFWLTPWSPLQAMAMALLAAVMGFLGGLVMSAIKRDRGVKDWGHVIPGHGGVLDRMDSVIFAAPVFFHVTRYFWSLS
ncbi:MAG: phosphatidate cytidylyltransferase [Pseudomonadota bacterium]